MKAKFFYLAIFSIILFNSCAKEESNNAQVQLVELRSENACTGQVRVKAKPANCGGLQNIVEVSLVLSQNNVPLTLPECSGTWTVGWGDGTPVPVVTGGLNSTFTHIYDYTPVGTCKIYRIRIVFTPGPNSNCGPCGNTPIVAETLIEICNC